METRDANRDGDERQNPKLGQEADGMSLPHGYALPSLVNGLLTFFLTLNIVFLELSLIFPMIFSLLTSIFSFPKFLFSHVALLINSLACTSSLSFSLWCSLHFSVQLYVFPSLQLSSGASRGLDLFIICSICAIDVAAKQLGFVTAATHPIEWETLFFPLPIYSL